MERNGRHDWRVDPSQVIMLLRDVAFVRVACAACGERQTMESRPRATDPYDISTWRPYFEDRR